MLASPIAVTFPVYNRPELLKRVLESWSKVRGIENALLLFSCEPGCDEVLAVCQSVDFADARISLNSERLGHAKNVLASMNWAFSYTDYAIQALDDYLAATDILELHGWHREKYLEDPSVLALSSSRDIPAPEGGLAGVWRCQLIGALSGFHSHKWYDLASWWSEATDAGWWQWVNEWWLQSGPGYDVLFPALSRAEDIGDDHPSSCFVPDAPPQQYYEVKGSRERASGFRRFWEAY